MVQNYSKVIGDNTRRACRLGAASFCFLTCETLLAEPAKSTAIPRYSFNAKQGDFTIQGGLSMSNYTAVQGTIIGYRSKLSYYSDNQFGFFIGNDLPFTAGTIDIAPAPEPQAKSESSSESNPDAKPVRDATLDVRSGQVVPESPLPEATTDASAPAKVGSGPQKKFIEAATLNIRSQPNRFSKIVGSLKGGDEVHVKIHGGWAKLDEGQWIRSRWLVKSRPSSFSNATDEDSAKPVKRSKAHNTKKINQKKRNNFKQTSGNQ